MQLDKKYRGSFVDGIFITEEVIEEHSVSLGQIRVSSNRMNSNLAELKKKLAQAALRKGATSVMRYKYGQKRTLLSLWDDTKWYAEGEAIKLVDKN